MIGMSGAELRNLCNEAALIATRDGKSKLDQADFDAAGDRVRLGAKREEQFGDEEKKRTAYHEAGHALCASLEPKAHKLDRVSIVPRGRSGGVTLFSPDEDRVDRSYHEFRADLVVMLGGRAADRLTMGEPLSGAVQDIRMATRTARLMVTQYGMSDRLGPVYYRQAEEHVFLGKDIHEGRDFSEGTARIIDEEIQRIVLDAEQRAADLLANNRDALEKLTAALIAHEELDREAVDRVLKGLPPFPASAPPPPAPTPPPVAAAEPPVVVEEPPPGFAFGGA
jgi:cell division protease FtsH